MKRENIERISRQLSFAIGNDRSEANMECYRIGFLLGWDACLEYLSKLPWDQAVKEIVECVEKSKEVRDE